MKADTKIDIIDRIKADMREIMRNAIETGNMRDAIEILASDLDLIGWIENHPTTHNIRS